MSMNTSSNRQGLPLQLPEGARVLIICGDDSTGQKLSSTLASGGFSAECADSITNGCEAAKSGMFQVIVSQPLLKDGSWRRLADIASHYDLRFEIILWTSEAAVSETDGAVLDGVFDILDDASEVSHLEITKRALWAAYLKGAGPKARAVTPLKAA